MARKRVLVALDEATIEAIDLLAADEDRSRSSWMRRALEAAVFDIQDGGGHPQPGDIEKIRDQHKREEEVARWRQRQ